MPNGLMEPVPILDPRADRVAKPDVNFAKKFSKQSTQHLLQNRIMYRDKFRPIGEGCLHLNFVNHGGYTVHHICGS